MKNRNFFLHIVTAIFFLISCKDSSIKDQVIGEYNGILESQGSSIVVKPDFSVEYTAQDGTKINGNATITINTEDIENARKKIKEKLHKDVDLTRSLLKIKVSIKGDPKDLYYMIIRDGGNIILWGGGDAFFEKGQLKVSAPPEKSAPVEERKDVDTMKMDTATRHVDEIKIAPTTSAYAGKIGAFPIHLQFTTTGEMDCPRGGAMFEGWYYYDKKGESSKIRIEGHYCGSSIYFDEYDAQGITNAGFVGLWAGDQIDGTWTGNGRSYELHLLSTDR